MPPATLLGLSDSAWTAIGTVVLAIATAVLAVGAVVTGALALVNYSKAKRLEAARWLQELFREFYLTKRFGKIRATLEYEYTSKARLLFERRLTNRDVPCTPEERVILEQLDVLLNYFELVLYLEGQEQLSRTDREAIFEYWFDLMRSPERAAVRRYSACFGFERVAAALDAGGTEYVALYGSLMTGIGLPEAPELDNVLGEPCPCEIPGALYDMGQYPALVVSDDDTVFGELRALKHRPPDSRALAEFKKLDEYERYDPHDPAGSLYVRHLVRLRAPRVDAWVYIYNREVGGHPKIESGDWRRHIAQREVKPPRT